MHSNTNSPIHLLSEDHFAYQVMGTLGTCTHETNPLTTWVMYVGMPNIIGTPPTKQNRYIILQRRSGV